MYALVEQDASARLDGYFCLLLHLDGLGDRLQVVAAIEHFATGQHRHIEVELHILVGSIDTGHVPLIARTTSQHYILAGVAIYEATFGPSGRFFLQ